MSLWKDWNKCILCWDKFGLDWRGMGGHRGRLRGRGGGEIKNFAHGQKIKSAI